MRHIPIAEFKDKVSEIVSAVEAGEEVVITRHGKPAVRLVAVDDESDRQTRAKAAWERLRVLRDDLHARGRTATVEEMIEWKNEGRR